MGRLWAGHGRPPPLPGTKTSCETSLEFMERSARGVSLDVMCTWISSLSNALHVVSTPDRSQIDVSQRESTWVNMRQHASVNESHQHVSVNESHPHLGAPPTPVTSSLPCGLRPDSLRRDSMTETAALSSKGTYTLGWPRTSLASSGSCALRKVTALAEEEQIKKPSRR